jgi:hypothetical protein
LEELRKRETENGARDTFNNLGRKSTHRTAMSDATRFRPGSTVRVSRNGSISIERTPTASEDYTSLTEETTTTSSINSRSTTSSRESTSRRSPDLSHRYSEAVARFERRLQLSTPLSTNYTTSSYSNTSSNS